MTVEPHRDDDFVVAVNEEEQYAIWPARLPLPAGWRGEGTRGTKDECRARVANVWTDMRPLSLRRSLDAGAPS